MIRYWGDKTSVLDRLQAHPFLTPKPNSPVCFETSCSDPQTASYLERILSYTPLTQNIRKPLFVIADSVAHPKSPSWLGVQQGQNIYLYYPAFQNAGTLAFTFFHEYGHWIQKNVLSDGDWELYVEKAKLNFNRLTEADVLSVSESFANDFAWFCTNPAYLSLQRPEVSAFFAERIGTNSC